MLSFFFKYIFFVKFVFKFATNRLRCLKELIKYKDLFYEDDFNQEAVKKYAFVSRLIDCTKFKH